MVTIERLPTELWFRIADYASFDDMKSLSMVHSSFRAVIAPQIFKHISVEKDQSKESLEYASKFVTSYGSLVTQVHYHCHLLPGKKGKTKGKSEVPEVIRSILAGKGMPNLKTVKLSFTAEEDFLTDKGEDWVKPEEDHYGEATIYIFQISETEDEVDEAEKVYQWRADMNDAYKAITSNKDIESVEIESLIPKHCSVWRSKEWKLLLNRLASFKISIWGGENGAGWHANTLDGYGEFIASTQKAIFQHLAAVRSLHLIAQPEVPIGCEGMNHSPTPLSKEHLPQLVELKLENWIVDPALIDFISTKEHMQSLKLSNCRAAAPEGLAENPISWTHVFQALRKMELRGLTTLEISGGRVYLSLEESYAEDGDEYDFDAEEENIKTVRRKVAADSRLKLFPYGSLDDKYGNVTDDPDVNVEAFEAGDDQKEYDALMDLVKHNVQ